MIDVLIATCLVGILVPFVLYPLVLWLHAEMAPAPVAVDGRPPEKLFIGTDLTWQDPQLLEFLSD